MNADDTHRRKNPPLRTAGVVALVLAGIGAVGIYAVNDRRDEHAVGTTETTGATPETTGATSHLQVGISAGASGGLNADAHAQIAGAHCDRAARCQGIGPNERYANREACESERRAQAANHLGREKCLQGVTEKVGACAAAIAATSCDTPLESLDSIQPCDIRLLCK